MTDENKTNTPAPSSDSQSGGGNTTPPPSADGPKVSPVHQIEHGLNPSHFDPLRIVNRGGSGTKKG